jgi:acylphosphatase
MGSEVIRARAVVRGRVQMVGFRAYVMRHARVTGLHGVVRNRHDGTLECVVEGPREAVDHVIESLKQGPPAARVDGVEVEFETPVGDLPAMTVSG